MFSMCLFCLWYHRWPWQPPHRAARYRLKACRRRLMRREWLCTRDLNLNKRLLLFIRLFQSRQAWVWIQLRRLQHWCLVLISHVKHRVRLCCTSGSTLSINLREHVKKRIKNYFIAAEVGKRKFSDRLGLTLNISGEFLSFVHNFFDDFLNLKQRINQANKSRIKPDERNVGKECFVLLLFLVLYLFQNHFSTLI